MGSICIDFDMDQFRDRDLIEELRDRRILTPAEATALKQRAREPVSMRRGIEIQFIGDSPLTLAADSARRGDFADCIVQLVRAFPELYPLQRLARSA